MFAQLRNISERSAAKEDLRQDICTSRQGADDLHRDRVKHRGCYIFLAHRTRDEILDVGLAEHSASRCDRVDILRPFRQVVQRFSLYSQQRSRLVDKGSSTSGAITVHPHVRNTSLFEENNLRVLSSDIYQRMYIRVKPFYHFCSSNHLLVKMYLEALRISHAYRAGDTYYQRILRREPA